MNLSRKQFNITQGPQGYTGPDGASEERRLGKAYVEDMATINAGGDASYFPGQGTSQGKFFHDPKPHDAVRWQRGYTPERQQAVRDTIEPRTLVPQHRYEDMNAQTKAKHDQASWEATEASRYAQRRATHGQHMQVTAEFTDSVARSDVPQEDLDRLKFTPRAEGNYDAPITGISVSRMNINDQAHAAGSIKHGRSIEMPLRSEATSGAQYHETTALHELGHAMDHLDRKASGRPDYISNEHDLRSYDNSDAKTEAVRQLGEMEGAADIYTYKYARGLQGEDLADKRVKDYPTGHYSQAYGSDRGFRGGGRVMTRKFTSEETKAFKSGYQTPHKAEKIKSPSKRTAAREKAGDASRAAEKAAWGSEGRPVRTHTGPSPELQNLEAVPGANDGIRPGDYWSDEAKAIRERNDTSRLTWSRY